MPTVTATETNKHPGELTDATIKRLFDTESGCFAPREQAVS